MKKTVTVLLALLLTAAMGMTAFAADISYLGSAQNPSVPDSSIPEQGRGTAFSEIQGFRYGEVNVAVMNQITNNTATGVLKGSVALSNGNYVIKSDSSKMFLFDLNASDKNASGKVTFALGKAMKGSTFLVLHYTNSAWEYVTDGIVDEQGFCNATVTGFSPYMVVTDATLRQPAPVKTSPKTGIR
ncbi:MAG: hypothetical protein RSC19_02075 [Lachnospiraceae bacterium]